MSEGAPEPEDCTGLDEVIAGVEAVDRAIIWQLARRFAYIRAAAQFKPDHQGVSDEEPHRRHKASARQQAFEQGVPVGLVSDFWDRLIDVSIAFERQAWERLRKEQEEQGS